MSRCLSVVFAAVVLAGCATPSTPPPVAPAPLSVERPIPYPVVPPPEFLAAVETGTRTATGEPGPRYWQNWADYRIDSRLLPEAKRMEGNAAIRYHNRSPDTLQVLVLDLTQNFHAPGAVRMEPAEVTGGVELTRVAVGGQALSSGGEAGPRYMVEGTKLVVVPPQPVGPGQTVDLGIDWGFTIPQAGAGARMGYDSDNLFFLAYWYPQMAVYDDVVGWHPDQFLGTSEFYAGFGNYDVTVEAPAGWVVMGTGELVNAEEVLAAPVLSRLRLAEQSDTVIQVLAGG